MEREHSALSFLLTSPLRLSGGCFSFVHKSFYEYFVAEYLLRRARELGKSRGRAAA